MKANLRPVLVLAFGLGFLTLAATAQAAQPTELAPHDMTFGPAPAVLPAGVQMAVLYGNPSAVGLSIVRLRIPPHTVFAPHWHPTDESFSVIKGGIWVGSGDTVDPNAARRMPVRSFVSLPEMMHHYVYTQGGWTVIDLSFYGPFQICYVNPHDDPSGTSHGCPAPYPQP